MNKLLTGVIIGYVFHDAIDEALEWLVRRGKSEVNVQYHNYSSAERPGSEPVDGEDQPPSIPHD